MPSEDPRLPSETYESLLRRDHTKGLGLQAGEVASYPRLRRSKAPLVIAGAIIITGVMIAGALS